MAPSTDAPGIELFVDHPIGQAFYADDLRPLGPERRIKILIAESSWILFDMAISIDDAHDASPRYGMFITSSIPARQSGAVQERWKCAPHASKAQNRERTGDRKSRSSIVGRFCSHDRA